MGSSNNESHSLKPELNAPNFCKRSIFRAAPSLGTCFKDTPLKKESESEREREREREKERKKNTRTSLETHRFGDIDKLGCFI